MESPNGVHENCGVLSGRKSVFNSDGKMVMTLPKIKEENPLLLLSNTVKETKQKYSSERRVASHFGG